MNDNATEYSQKYLKKLAIGMCEERGVRLIDYSVLITRESESSPIHQVCLVVHYRRPKELAVYANQSKTGKLTTILAE